MNKTLRIKKHQKIRKRVIGTKDRPRLSVYKSNQHIFTQAINDQTGKTLVSVSDLKMNKMQKGQRAYEVGKKVAESLLKLKIKKVVFDRGGFLYHGRIAMVGKGAREGGLEF